MDVAKSQDFRSLRRWAQPDVYEESIALELADQMKTRDGVDTQTAVDQCDLSVVAVPVLGALVRDVSVRVLTLRK